MSSYYISNRKPQQNGKLLGNEAVCLKFSIQEKAGVMIPTLHRIIIVDDHAIFRAGIKALLDSEPDIEVVGEAEDGLSALQAVNNLNPDLIISDLSMPRTSGTEGIRQIRKRFPDMGIIVLTVHRAEEYIRAALSAGANGYVLKDDSEHELLTAIHRVMNKKIYLSPSICSNVVAGFLGERNQNPSAPSWDCLSPREQQVLKLIAEGHRNKDIAEYLSISPKTVEKHRGNLMRKLDLHDVSSLTIYAINNGVISTL
jgi:DNA-binding NarL/FixJ family response regulator